jgi:hypothetical protein
MEYALLIYVPGAWEQLPDEEREALYREYAALREAPGFIGGAELEPVGNATTVRVKHGETLTTDGPFADTKEVFGGFYLFEADDIETVVGIAARIPAARIGGSVEIRPIVHR